MLDLCCSQTLKEFPKKSEVKKLGLISLRWVETEGYIIIPTWQNVKIKNAFDHMEDKSIKVSNKYSDYELAVKFREVIKLSPIGPMSKRPEEEPLNLNKNKEGDKTYPKRNTLTIVNFPLSIIYWIHGGVLAFDGDLRF